MAAVVFACHAVLAVVAAASEPAASAVEPARPAYVPAYERPGLTASIGFGNAYGFLGAQLRYDWPLRAWVHVAPFVAGGAAIDHGGAWPAWAGGVSGGLGRKRRLTADLAIAPVAAQSLELHGTFIAGRTFYGPQVAIGFEHVSTHGWMQRLTVGYGWGLWVSGANQRVDSLTLTLGVGRRVW